jgi:ATP-binding cassette subfamily C protein LapB
MLLDEPTASMDPQLEELVAERVFGMRPKETTLVVVTHKLGMLKHFTRIVVVDKGRVVGDGPRDEMIASMKGAVAQAAPPHIAGKTPQTQPSSATA